MADSGSNVRESFLKISNCEVAFDILDGVVDGFHPCRKIVESQHVSPDDFQLPEPWVGHIESAPLLFVASNPSIGDDQHALRRSSPEDVWNSHVRLFDDDAGYTKDGIYTILPDGRRSRRWVPHWAFVRAQASTLLARRAVPGKDFALTEVVHCKSRDEIGVSDCAAFCTDYHFQRVLSASGCRLIIAMGGHAQRELRRFFKISDDTVYTKLPENRRIVFVPHSNFRGPRKLEHAIPHHLNDVRSFLEQCS